MSLASLEAFLEQAQGDQRLQELLVEAPDAAAVAAIAQAAGFPVSELDLWQACGATPEEIFPEVSDSPPPAPLARPLPGESGQEPPRGTLPDPWLEENDTIGRFLQQAEGDEALQQALVQAPDAAAVAAIAREAGYPIRELDLWRASGASPEEIVSQETSDGPRSMREEPGPEGIDAPEVALSPEGAWTTPGEEALLGFLHQALGDEALQEALAEAPDAEAVAFLARAAGYPISALDLWRAAGGTHAEDLLPAEPDLSSLEAPLARFLLEAEYNASLQDALAVAEDAAAVAAIAQAAGYPITAADLWEATEAVPQELVIDEIVLEEWTVVECEDDREWA